VRKRIVVDQTAVRKKLTPRRNYAKPKKMNHLHAQTDMKDVERQPAKPIRVDRS